MNLYAVGCSFTHGHGEWDNPKTINNSGLGYRGNDTHQFSFVWPWQLKNQFENVVNDAFGGTGIQYAGRQLSRFLCDQKDNLDQWVVVLQVSQYVRRAFLCGEHNLFLMPCYKPDNRDMSKPFDELMMVEHNHPHYQPIQNIQEHHKEHIRKIRHTMAEYYFLVQDDRSIMYDHVCDLSRIVHTLETLGVKYLITGMHTPDYEPETIKQTYADIMCEPTLNLLDLMPVHNFIGCINSIVGNRYQPVHHLDHCDHPNKQGHKLISEYILSEIEKRGWL